MEGMRENLNMSTAISNDTQPTSCNDTPTATDTSAITRGQLQIEELRDCANAEEKPFRFMDLPPELRENVIKHIYIRNINEVPIHRRGQVRGHCFPHLACNLHLVCRSIFAEMVAFVARQPKIPVQFSLQEHITRDDFDGVVTKRLLCPAIGEVSLKFEHQIYRRLNWVAQLVLFGVYYIQQLQPSIPKLTVVLHTKGFTKEDVEPRRRSTYRNGNVEIIVDILTMKFVTKDPRPIIQSEVEQALDAFQDASGNRRLSYARFVKWLTSNKGRKFGCGGVSKDELRSWESITDQHMAAFLAKQKNRGKFFGLSAIDKFNAIAPAHGKPRMWPRSCSQSLLADPAHQFL